MNRVTVESVARVLEYFRSFGFEHVPIRGAAELLASLDSKKGGIVPPRPVPSTAPSSGEGTKGDQLKTLREEIGDCRRCKLHDGRTNIVFGEGNAGARLMFVGEGPGREEDLQGRPFVGDAGQLLTRLIERMGLKRTDVYIANVVKCRPPMNRDPEDDEISSCMPFLRRQIEIISPEVIMSLGRISAHTLLGSTSPMSKFSITRERGKLSEYTVGERSIPLMPTFHPAYLLRNRSEKKATWQDAQAVLRLLGLAAGTTEAS